MTRAKILQPDLILGDTIVTLSPDILKFYNLSGLILDVDETLVPLQEKEASPQLRDWIDSIRPLVSIWLVSNNVSDNRIGTIARSLDLPYIIGAVKPSRRKLRQALAAMNLPPEKVAMVGDRLFTDVLAGNRLGMVTILVEPMVDPGVATSHYPIRNFEVWISQKLGVSLAKTQHNFMNPDKQ